MGINTKIMKDKINEILQMNSHDTESGIEIEDSMIPNIVDELVNLIERSSHKELNLDEIRYLIFYGETLQGPDHLKIDDTNKKLDMVFHQIYDMLSERTHFTAYDFSQVLWARIQALANRTINK